MKKKILLVIGILGAVLVFGAAVAMAQNTNNGKTKDLEDHECTPEMMENMSENCPEQMMLSGACENMMDVEKGCGEMMGAGNRASDPGTKKVEHCEDMGSMTGEVGKDMMQKM